MIQPVDQAPGKSNKSKRRTQWHRAPLMSTMATIAMLPIAFICFGLSVMSADQCGSTADCPKTFAAMNLTQKLIAASVIVAAGQWVPGRRLPHVVRLLLAWVPPLLVLAAIRNAFATPTG